jgi:hypothetical protein
MAKGKKPRKKTAKKNVTPRSRKGVGGAPSKYDSAYAEQVTKLCKLGATGYQYDEVTYERLAVGETGMAVDDKGDIEATKKEAYKRKVVTKEVAPDVAAQNIWLKNRRGKVDKTAQRWADKHEVTGEGGGPIEIKQDLTKLSKEELKLLLALTKKAEGE